MVSKYEILLYISLGSLLSSVNKIPLYGYAFGLPVTPFFGVPPF